uniref:hypothetical protein n=1 Tax=Noviherbaspirillum pedocola TaxID=2801341 RepID=UPI0038995D15
MDGYTLLAALRAHAATASTPAIALSGFTRPRDVQQALDAGFETHACKPIVLEQFLRMASRIAK